MRESHTLRPVIDYADMHNLYFLHNGHYYNVAESPDAVFIDAVRAHWPYVAHSDVGTLLKGTLDVHTRWYILCEMAHNKHKMKMHSRERIVT